MDSSKDDNCKNVHEDESCSSTVHAYVERICAATNNYIAKQISLSAVIRFLQSMSQSARALFSEIVTHYFYIPALKKTVLAHPILG